MGQKKYCRYNIKQQIHSLEFKNKFFYLKNINLSRYGLCLAEAELLAEVANKYYQNQLLDIPENYFSIPLYLNLSSKKKQNLNNLKKTMVNIPAFSHHELEIYQYHGLPALQTYRIINMLDSIAYQNAMIDLNLLGKIVNISPKSIRKKLIPLIKAELKLPLTYLSGKWSSTAGLFRYTISLRNFLLFDFYQFSYGHGSFSSFPNPLLEEISLYKNEIMRTPKYHELTRLYPPLEIPDNGLPSDKNHFYSTLKYHFSFSDALITDYLKFLENEAGQSNNCRKPGDIIYYAVADKTISGTPLSVTELIPITLSFWSDDDKEPQSADNTRKRKWNKSVRYSL